MLQFFNSSEHLKKFQDFDVRLQGPRLRRADPAGGAAGTAGRPAAPHAGHAWVSLRQTARRYCESKPVSRPGTNLGDEYFFSLINLSSKLSISAPNYQFDNFPCLGYFLNYKFIKLIHKNVRGISLL